MKKIILFLVCLLTLAISANAEKVNKDLYRYELEAYDGVPAAHGYIIVKVWSYGKKKIVTNDYCMRNAVHGILFKGCPGVGANAGVKALVPEGYETHKDFFDEFFKDKNNGGKYWQFVQLTNQGQRDAGDVIKLKGGRYKVGTIVMINLSELRKYLEKNNIIKTLNSFFE